MQKQEDPTGGPIAPTAHMLYDMIGRCQTTVPTGGVTMLDQFAMSAVNALLLIGESNPTILAERAYKIGEALLLEKRRRA